MKKKFIFLAALLAACLLGGCVSQADYDALSDKYSELEKQVQELRTDVDKINERFVLEETELTEPAKQIEITKENFLDYFEYSLKTRVSKDVFGDLDEVIVSKLYVLKDEYVEGLDYPASKVNVKFLCSNRSEMTVELDKQTESVTVLKEEIIPPSDYDYLYDNDREIISEFYQSIDKSFYYVYYCYADEKIPDSDENVIEIETNPFAMYYDVEIVDVLGTLVYE